MLVHKGDCLLPEIIKAIEFFQDPIHRAEVNISIAQQFNLIHQPDEALQFIEQALQDISLISIEETFISNDLKCQVAEQLAKANLQNRSIEMLTQALQQAAAFEDPETRDYALIHVAEAYAEIGLYDRAIQIGLMVNDEYDRVWRLFDSIARIAAQHTDHEQIPKLLAVIKTSRDRDHILLEAANAYSASNQVERAIALVSLMTSPSTKANALVKAAKRLDVTIALDQKLDLLNQAETYALAERNTSKKAQLLRIVAEQHIELTQFSRAYTLLEQAKHLAISSRAADCSEKTPQDFVLMGVARAFGKLAESVDTIQTTDAMTDRVLSGSTLANTVREDSSELLRFEAIQQLTAVETALTGHHSHIADLRRVRIAEAWAEMKIVERVQAIAQQIDDSNLRKLALRYAGIGVAECEYDVFERLSKACESASEQSNIDEGLRILTHVLEQVLSFEERDTTLFLTRIINAYFKLIST